MSVVGVGTVIVKIVNNIPMILVHKRNKDNKNEGGLYGFPGGSVDPTDKDTEATAYRELQEETGITKEDIKKFIHVKRHMTPKGMADSFMAILKEDVHDKKFCPEPKYSKSFDTEFGHQWMTLEEIQCRIQQFACYCVLQFEYCLPLLSNT
jgi:8-oxo-dGTP pyrophosphatase MutT (NUDIX family)